MHRWHPRHTTTTFALGEMNNRCEYTSFAITWNTKHCTQVTEDLNCIDSALAMTGRSTWESTHSQCLAGDSKHRDRPCNNHRMTHWLKTASHHRCTHLHYLLYRTADMCHWRHDHFLIGSGSQIDVLLPLKDIQMIRPHVALSTKLPARVDNNKVESTIMNFKFIKLLVFKSSSNKPSTAASIGAKGQVYQLLVELWTFDPSAESPHGVPLGPLGPVPWTRWRRARLPQWEKRWVLWHSPCGQKSSRSEPLAKKVTPKNMLKKKNIISLFSSPTSRFSLQQDAVPNELNAFAACSADCNGVSCGVRGSRNSSAALRNSCNCSWSQTEFKTIELLLKPVVFKFFYFQLESLSQKIA